jgi:hypothetical protein
MVIDCKQVCAERYTMNLAGGTLLNAYICVYVAAASLQTVCSAAWTRNVSSALSALRFLDEKNGS